MFEVVGESLEQLIVRIEDIVVSGFFWRFQVLENMLGWNDYVLTGAETHGDFKRRFHV